MLGQTKPQLDQAAAAVAQEGGDGDELVGRERRRAEFEERLRGAEESHRLEVAAKGNGPVEVVIPAQAVVEEQPKPVSSGWSSWFGSSKRDPQNTNEDKKP